MHGRGITVCLAQPFHLIIFLFSLLLSPLLLASSYEVNKAVEYYENGEYKRAKSFLSTIDLSRDPIGSYYMGAISLKDDELAYENKMGEAIIWFQISADLGFAQANHALGRLYEGRWNQNQNKMDLELSLDNYKIAYNKGFDAAKIDVLRLEPGHKFPAESKLTSIPVIEPDETETANLTSSQSGVEASSISPETRKTNFNHNDVRLIFTSSSLDFVVSNITVDVDLTGLTLALSKEITENIYVTFSYEESDGDASFSGLNIDIEGDATAIGIFYNLNVTKSTELVVGIEKVDVELEASFQGSSLLTSDTDHENLVLGANIALTDKGLLNLLVEIDIDDTDETVQSIIYMHHMNGIENTGIVIGFGIEIFDDGESIGFGVGTTF